MRRLCKVLEVHPSGFYAWRLNPESERAREDKRLLVPIKESWLESGSVIPAVSIAAQAADEAMFSQQGLVLVSCVLTAAVGMDDQSSGWAARLDRHAQGITDQGGWHARRHRPAHDSAREQVKHDSQVQPAGASADLRDIRGVSQIWRYRIELPGQHVRRNRQGMPAVGRGTNLRFQTGFRLA